MEFVSLCLLSSFGMNGMRVNPSCPCGEFVERVDCVPFPTVGFSAPETSAWPSTFNGTDMLAESGHNGIIRSEQTVITRSFSSPPPPRLRVKLPLVCDRNYPTWLDKPAGGRIPLSPLSFHRSVLFLLLRSSDAKQKHVALLPSSKMNCISKSLWRAE